MIETKQIVCFGQIKNYDLNHWPWNKGYRENENPSSNGRMHNEYCLLRFEVIVEGSIFVFEFFLQELPSWASHDVEGYQGVSN